MTPELVVQRVNPLFLRRESSGAVSVLTQRVSAMVGHAQQGPRGVTGESGESGARSRRFMLTRQGDNRVAYTGTAPLGAGEDDPVWTIVVQTYSLTGQMISQVLTEDSPEDIWGNI